MAVGIFWVLTYNSVNYRMTWLIKSEEVEYRFFFHYVHLCICVYVCMPHACNACGGQKWALDAPELELKMTMSCHMDPDK